MNLDTWNGCVSVDVDIDDVLTALVDHFRDFPNEDLYFNRHGRLYILRVVEDREPYGPDTVLSSLSEISQLAAELSGVTDDARVSRIIAICDDLRHNRRLEQFIEEGNRTNRSD